MPPLCHSPLRVCLPPKGHVLHLQLPQPANLKILETQNGGQGLESPSNPLLSDRRACVLPLQKCGGGTDGGKDLGFGVKTSVASMVRGRGRRGRPPLHLLA